MSRRRLAIAAVAAVFVLLFGGRWVALRYTEYLWFADLGQGDRYRWLMLRAVAWQVATLVVSLAWFGAHTLGVYASIGSVHLPRRLGNLEIDEAVPARTLRAIALAVATLLAVAMTWTFADLDRYIALARNAAPFGLTEPVLHHDVSFYLAVLPLLEVLHLGVTVATVLAVLLVVGLYALTGSFTISRRHVRITPHARIHLIILLCALAAVLSWGFQLGAVELVAGGGHALGALSPADRAVRIPAAHALATIGLVAAVGSALALRWVRPPLLLWLWVIFGVTAVLGRFVVPVMTEAWGAAGNPALVQSVARLVDGYSRTAFGLGDTPTRSIPEGALDADSGAALAEAVDGIYAWSGEPGLPGRLLDAQAGDTTGIRAWNVTPTDAAATGRSIPAALVVPHTNFLAATRAMPRPRWTLLHRGALAWGGEPVALDARLRAGPARFLAALAPADTAPPGTPVRRTSGRIRILSQAAELAVVGPDEATIGEPAPGVLLSGMVRRILLAWSLQAPPLLSDRTSNADRVLYWRDLPTRLARLYPFATFDPGRAALIEGRLTWIADGYLASARFPLAETLRWRGEVINHLSNPYVVTVDASSGQTRFYLRPSAGAFAASVARAAALAPLPSESLPPAVRRALRYPTGLLGAQAAMIGRRGTRESPATRWAVGWQDTAVAGHDAALVPVTRTLAAFDGRAVRSWQLVPVVDGHGGHLAGLVAGAVSEAGDNDLTLLLIPGSATPTPQIVAARIGATPALLAASGFENAPRRGPVLVVPAAGTIAFVQALFGSVGATGMAGPIDGVAIYADGRVGFGPDARSAVHALQRGDTQTMLGALAGPELAEARAAFLALDSARLAGDWERFGRAWANLRRALRLESSGGARP